MDPHLELRQKLDEEITKLERRLHILRFKRNSLIPIATLPCEIIQHIFVLSHQADWNPLRVARKASLVVSWVFQRWREIALDTPLLWSHVDFINAHWVRLAISRSRNRQLELSFHLPRGNWHYGELISVALCNIAKTKTLEVRSEQDSELPFQVSSCSLHNLWDAPAALLEQLCLEHFYLYNPSKPIQFPLLTTLHLGHCEFTWETIPLFPNLTALTIIKPHSFVSVTRFLADIIIPMADRIQHLALTHVFIDFDPTGPPPLPAERISLGKLARLHLDNHPALLLQLFRHIAFRRQVQISLSVRDDPELEFPTLSELVLCRGVDAWPVKSIYVFGWEGNLVMRIEEDWEAPSGDLDGSYYYSAPKVSSDFLELVFPNYSPQIFSLFHILPFTPIRALTIHGPQPEAILIEAIRSFSTLESIKFLSLDTTAIPSCGAWMESRTLHIEEDGEYEEMTDEWLDGGQEFLGFRGLRELRLFRSEPGECVDLSMDYDDQISDMLQWVKVRKRFRIPIERLVLEGVVLDAEKFERVGRFVGRVE